MTETTSPDLPGPGGPGQPRPTRARLPWQAFVAATVLALAAAVGVVLVLGGDDAGDDGPGRTSLTLTEVDVQAATRVEFERSDGSTATLADYAGEPLVVNFFGSWCTPCIKEMPDIEAVHQRSADRVQIVGIAVNDRPETAAEIIEETGVTYEWGRDVDASRLVTTLGVVAMPSTAFVDAHGTVVHVAAGALDQAKLVELIREHLGVEVPA